MRIPKPALLVLLIIGYVVWVLSLAAQLRAETARYEYRATPDAAPGPIFIPCFVLDRFNYLCIETGTIFVDVASSRCRTACGPESNGTYVGWPTDASPFSHAFDATPRIILARQKFASIFLTQNRDRNDDKLSGLALAHQKLAIDGWVDRTRNKKGERCCDAGKDCHSLNPDEVKHVPGGVNIRLGEQTIHIPGEEIMPSEDGRYWVCYWGNKVRCFFAPFSGS